MSFQANYPGTCQECGEWFKVGDWIDRHIDGYQHTECRPTSAEDSRSAACTHCLLIHAGSCF